MTGAHRRGTLTLVFDDGYTEVTERVVPVLRQYGVKAVFAVPVSSETIRKSAGAPVASLADWQHLCAREGHELAAHGVSHAPLTMLSQRKLEADLDAAQKATGATTLVYPGGAQDERVRAATRGVFRAARGVLWGMETLPPKDRYALRTFNATRKNFSVLRWNIRALFAWLLDRWCIETYHRFTNDPAIFHAVRLEDFERHLRFVTRLPLRIATIRTVLKTE